MKFLDRHFGLIVVLLVALFALRWFAARGAAGTLAPIADDLRAQIPQSGGAAVTGATPAGDAIGAHLGARAAGGGNDRAALRAESKGNLATPNFGSHNFGVTFDSLQIPGGGFSTLFPYDFSLQPNPRQRK